ncbi:MAG: response regulator transcription factor, partial [Anaerolineae bacterium]
MASSIRILLVDDHPALHMGLRIVLEQAPGVQVVAEAGSGREALALIQALRPDVAVLDCQLPDMPGSQAAAELRRLGLATRVLALSAYTDDAAIRGMVEAGAVGYLLKEEAPAAIVDAVRSAARGEGRWSASVASRLA